MTTLRDDSGAERGSALVAATIVTVTLSMFAFVLASFSLRLRRENLEVEARLGAFYAAEAGLSRAWVQLQNGGDGAIGNARDPARIGGLEYWVTADTLGEGLISLVPRLPMVLAPAVWNSWSRKSAARWRTSLSLPRSR